MSIKRDRLDNRPANFDKRYMTARPYSANSGISFDELSKEAPAPGSRVRQVGNKTVTSSTSRLRVTMRDKTTGKTIPQRKGR